MKQLNPLQIFEREDHEPYIYLDRWTPEEAASLLALGCAGINLESWRNTLLKRIPLPCASAETPWEWVEYFEMVDAYNNMLEATRRARLSRSDGLPESPRQWLEWAKCKALTTTHFESFLIELEAPAKPQRNPKAPQRHGEKILDVARSEGIDLNAPISYEKGFADPTKQKLLKLSGLSEKSFAAGWKYLKDNDLRKEATTFKK